jgi:hypothetical protein
MPKTRNNMVVMFENQKAVRQTDLSHLKTQKLSNQCHLLRSQN